MLKRLRFRPLALTAAVGTASLMAATMAVLLPGGTAAAAGEKVYESNFNAPCVIGPGILNIKSTFNISTKATGPGIG